MGRPKGSKNKPKPKYFSGPAPVKLEFDKWKKSFIYARKVENLTKLVMVEPYIDNHLIPPF